MIWVVWVFWGIIYNYIILADFINNGWAVKGKRKDKCASGDGGFGTKAGPSR